MAAQITVWFVRLATKRDRTRCEGDVEKGGDLLDSGCTMEGARFRPLRSQRVGVAPSVILIFAGIR
jgi:hypothetical protein